MAPELSKDVLQKSFRIQTKEDKFYTRLMSRETPASSPSFRVYYTVASGAVPFLWESRPGKPKDPSAAASLLPPLTPPPSYARRTSRPVRNKPTALRISTLLPCLRSNKNSHTSSDSLPTSPSMSSSSSSHTSSPVAPVVRRRWTRFSNSGSSSSSLCGYDEDPEVASPRSTLCFGRCHAAAEKDGIKWWWYKMFLARRKATLIAGHGSDHHGHSGCCK